MATGGRRLALFHLPVDRFLCFCPVFSLFRVFCSLRNPRGFWLAAVYFSPKANQSLKVLSENNASQPNTKEEAKKQEKILTKKLSTETPNTISLLIQPVPKTQLNIK